MRHVRACGLMIVGLLTWSALWALVGAMPLASAAPASGAEPPCETQPPPALARNVILFIGDGMQLEHEIAASRYLFGTDRALSFHQFPYSTGVTTWDRTTYDRYAWRLNVVSYAADTFDPLVGFNPRLGGAMPYPLEKNLAEAYFLTPLFPFGRLDSPSVPATDSASAATALATGNKTDKGNISWRMGDPVDGQLDTICELLRIQKGGLSATTSTVPFSHATPACFAAHGPDRGDYQALAKSMLNEVQADVIIGGGHPLYAGGIDAGYQWEFIGEDTYNIFHASESHPDYVFVERTPGQAGEDLLAHGVARAKAENKKLFGLFGGPEGNMESPLPTSDGTGVVFRATTENPLLKHIATQTLGYLRDMDDGKGFFAHFEQGDIDWANHDNDYARMIGCTWDLHEAVQAATDFVDTPGDDITWENTLIIVTSDHSNSFLRIQEALGKGVLPQQAAVEDGETREGYVGDFEYPDGEVTYGSGGHTNEPVMVYAKGAGAELFKEYEGAWYTGTRLIDNTHIFNVMARALGLNAKTEIADRRKVAAAR